MITLYNIIMFLFAFNLCYVLLNFRQLRGRGARSRCQSSPANQTYVPGHHYHHFELPDNDGQPNLTTQERHAHISFPTADIFSKHDTLYPLHEIPSFS